MADSGGSFPGRGLALKRIMVLFLTDWKILHCSPQRSVGAKTSSNTGDVRMRERCVCGLMLHFADVNEQCCVEEIAAYFPRPVKVVWQGGCTVTN